MSLNIHSPDIVIECEKFKQSIEVYNLLRKLNTKVYCYAICYRKGLLIDFIKIGESAPNPGENTAVSIGERIKRQLDHVPGWQDPPHYSSHGSEFWSNICRETKLGTLPSLTKDDLIVGIWDLTAHSDEIDFLYKNNKEVSMYAEGLLCDQYKGEHNGNLPILNIKDPTRNKAYKGPKFPPSIFDFA
jgi:hypothetical protein